MGINPIEYRAWKGERAPQYQRVLVISYNILRQKLRSKGILALLILGMILIHVFTIIFSAMMPHEGLEPEDIIGSEAEELASRQERRVQGKGRVFRRCADEDDASFLEKRKKDVLLRTVEAVNLVEEEEVTLPFASAPKLRILENPADLANTGQSSGTVDEPGLRPQRDDPSDRRLPGPGRSPKEERSVSVALDERAERSVRAEQVFLADHIVENRRTHPLGEGRWRGVSER